MPARIFSVDYYYTTVANQPGQGCAFLKALAAGEVNLLAFNAFPVSPEHTQLVIYPQNSTWLGELARRQGLHLQGPHHAFLVQGDDELGALLSIHQKLCDADINVTSSTGLTDGRGRYRYILHVEPEAYDRSLEVLGVDQGLQRWVDFELKHHRRFSKAQA
ncbi:MAG TPA: hypothetical protein PLL30_01380 [Candidatus Krumholzibacteria bacterium]|nr:hypothetical protein [Candidatus Krumholzibacteria bacterium]HPD70415.1 hypothetical protein [Candidatus Krumholzibacteria bacterium]HRY39885.1 hypothetical protein [Candidatus Krumholzibacteria bacterium]